MVFFTNDTYIDIPSDLGYRTNFSVFRRFKHKGTPPNNLHILFGASELEISIHSSGYLRTGMHTNTRHVSNHGSGVVDGNWHYVGFTFDGSTKKSYLNGYMEEVAVYDRVLSESEIQSNMINKTVINNNALIYSDNYTFSGLISGNHTITVEDNVGNVATKIITIP